MSESTHEPDGDPGRDPYAAPASDDDHEPEDGGPETRTPFASEGGSDVPGARTDGPREPDEPQREE